MTAVYWLIQRTSISRPVLLLALFVPLLLLSIWGVFRISFEDGLRSMFTADNAEFRNYDAYASQFAQSESDFIVLVSSASGFDHERLSQLEDFILDAQFVDGIAGVFSVFSLRSVSDEGDQKRLLPTDLSNKAAVNNALVKASEPSFVGLSLVSEDLHQTIVVLSLGPQMSDMTAPSAILRNLQGLADQYGANAMLSFQITGLIPVREGIIQGLKRDQKKINTLGALFGFLLSLIVFRNFWIAIMNSFTPVVALILCLGTFGWLGLTINALTNALPVLILVLASSDSIHLTFEIRRRMGLGEESSSAVWNAVKDLAAPCILTSLTTMLAFSSLFYSSSPIVRDLALAGTAGVFLAMVVVLFVHPAVFIIGSRFPSIKRALPQAIPLSMRSFEILKKLCFSANKKVTTIVGVTICAGAMVVLLPVQPSYRFLENLNRSAPVVEALEAVERVAGPVNSINVPLIIRPAFQLSDAQVLLDLKKVHTMIEKLPGIRAAVSPYSMALVLPDSSSANLAEIIDVAPQRFRDRMVGSEGRRILVAALVIDEGSQSVAETAERIKAAVGKMSLPSLDAQAATGFLVMSSALAEDMIGQLTISFLIAALVCPALIGLWYKRLDFGLAAIVPNILPIMLAGAFLTMIDVDIQITAALAFTIAFGIALDDSIHVFNRIHLESKGSSKDNVIITLGAAMNKVAPILVATTMILTAGLLATLTSEMPMIRFFGLICIGTFLLALLADLLLLPSIISWLGNWKNT